MNSSESFEINLEGGEIKEDIFNNEHFAILIAILIELKRKKKLLAEDNYYNYLKDLTTILPKISSEVRSFGKRNDKRKKEFFKKLNTFLTNTLKSKLKEEIVNLAKSSHNINNDKSDPILRDESIANIKAALALI